MSTRSAARLRVNGGPGGGIGTKGTRFLGYENVAIGGLEDEFLAPTEAASPSANLVAGLSPLTLVPFDGIPTAGAGVEADKIVIGFADASGFHQAWSRYLGSTSGFGDPGLTGRPWLTGRDTTIVLDLASLPRSAATRLSVMDVSGRRVRTLFEGKAEAGIHRVNWNGTSQAGAELRSGIYFVRLEADGATVTRKVVFARQARADHSWKEQGHAVGGAGR